MEDGKEILQWHPAFYAALQVELEEEKGQLAFTNEYQLGTKPRAIDVLIIKREAGRKVNKNIGRIFRKYNIVEYKSPTDYLSIDDFYKGLAYVCLYKADSAEVNKIDIRELTLTFAVSRYPREVLKQLRAEERHIVEEAEKGIYYVKGSLVPIQIIVLSQLSAEKNLWFRVLTDKLRDRKIASRMLAEYEKHRENSFCSSVMDVVVRANEKMFKEEENEMCELLEQIIDEKVDKRVAEILKRKEQEAIQEGIREGRQEGIREGRQEGIREGRREGIQEGIKEGMRILKNVVRRLQKMNLSTEQIAYVMEENVETVEAWLAEA